MALSVSSPVILLLTLASVSTGFPQEPKGGDPPTCKLIPPDSRSCVTIEIHDIGVPAEEADLYWARLLSAIEQGLLDRAFDEAADHSEEEHDHDVLGAVHVRENSAKPKS